MSQSPDSVAPDVSSAREQSVPPRPFRVKLRGSILVLLRLPNRRQVRGKLHQLSTSGGVIHVEKPLDEKVDVDLIFHLGKVTLREKVQMLFPMWATQGWLQPFKFVDLPEASKKDLEANLRSFVQDMQSEEARGQSASS